MTVHDGRVQAAEPDSVIPERLLSRGEAARYLGVPVSTIYHWAKSGRLRFHTTLGGHLRFARTDLDATRVRPARARDRTTD